MKKSGAKRELLRLEKGSHRPREREKSRPDREKGAAKEKWFCKRL
jgi:hypothetical protein